MLSRSVKAVIFDCDGTLVDSETLSLAVLVELVAELGLQIDYQEAMDRFAGNELSVVFRELERRLGKPLPDDFLETFRTQQIAVLKDSLEPVAGVHELLASLTLPFCVASNAPLHKIQVCLTTTGLRSHFADSQIFSAYEINSWKPAPDLFLAAARHLNFAPEDCAVVEDSAFGVEAGITAGMQVIGFDPHGKLEDEFSDICCIQEMSKLQGLLHSSA